ncbi:MAG: flagellar export chaperone FliS [Candidatus Wallbacteria bacterium HGW-Wallbacteria-1]|jgi:flagellar protein FliS|uniref:Flagellar secretion chaperone FliS n=1 Tax=Candidatus Wallbacteria bacterium HGW-Wallbacteria-1 TaxID=2013854 RepID=A0A2N1PUI3_9BACT|nr:MAG: flagellar export chaperone FliS [Candidatus Wallbacteria bacterium HGW-Wallbacteria-1]
MYYSNKVNNYKQTQITTASPGRLVILMYDGCIRFLNQAKAGIREKRLDMANNNIVRTQKILNELSLVLDMEKGGEIAKNLWRLYDYMVYRLIDINIKKDEEAIDEIIVMLEQLRDAWTQVISQERGIAPGGNQPGFEGMASLDISS